MEKQREEQLLLEKEQREKKKLKEKERIKRKKEEGSYLTKEQREKLERARIQLEAAGVQVPVRHPTQAATSASTESTAQPVKKRVLYDDRRKKNQTNTKRKCPTWQTLSSDDLCLEEDHTEETASKSKSTVTPNDLAKKPTAEVSVSRRGNDSISVVDHGAFRKRRI